MKANLRTLAIAACLAVGTCAQAQGVFLRPEVTFNFASLSGSDANSLKTKDAVGYGVEAGTRFGAQDENEFGFSASMLKFSLAANNSANVVVGHIQVVPLLANFRYYFGAKGDAVRCYVAPSAGWTNIKADSKTYAGTTLSSFASNGSCFTWAGAVGALVKLDDRFGVDFGFRYTEALRVRATNIKATVGTLYAGINFRF